MIHLKLIGLLLACVGRTTLAGLLPDGGANGYQYNRPNGGQDFGNVATGGGLDLGGGNRRGFGDRFGTGFTGNGFAARPSTGYGTPGFGNNPTGGNLGGGFNNGSPGFGNRPSGSYGPPGSGFVGGTQTGGYQQQNGGGGFNGGYQGTGGGDGYYQGGGGGAGGGGYNGDNGRPQPYSFQYEVRDPPSGNDYAQQESSDGNVVRGEYRVLLPDSRTQIVKYTADDSNGYNADVQYEGQAQFPRGGGGGGGGGVGGGGGIPGGYNQFGGDAGYQAGGFGPVNNYQGGRGGGGSGGYTGGPGPGGIFPSGGGGAGGGGISAGGGVTEPGSNGNRYLPPGNGGYGK